MRTHSISGGKHVLVHFDCLLESKVIIFRMWEIKNESGRTSGFSGSYQNDGFVPDDEVIDPSYVPDPDEILTVEVHDTRTMGRSRSTSARGGRSGRRGTARGSQSSSARLPRVGNVDMAGRPASHVARDSASQRPPNVGNPIPSGDPDPYDKLKKYCWITDINLKVNGESPESFKGPGTRYECPMDFLNLQTTQGFFHTNKTNSIDPELFQRNCFIGE
jgi:hypothetical protein